jgi:integrase
MDARSGTSSDIAHRVPKRVEQKDARVPGLRLRIGARRSTWVLICKIGRHPSRHTLGHFPAMTRAEARAEALRIKAALASGADPAVRALRNAQAFGDVCEDYFRDIKRRGLRSARETERDTRRDLRAWWHRPVDRLERADILRLVRDVTDNRSPAAAHHAFSYCSRILNWCVEQGLIKHSPCYGLRPSRLIGEKQPRRRILNDDELRALWIVAGTLGTAGVFVKVLLLTGQRRGEVAGMRWSEIHNGLWVIPAARMKSKREHTVPLVPEVRALLDSLPRFTSASKADYVFTNDGRRCLRGFDHVKNRIDALMPPGTPPFTIHDIRRSVRSSLAELGVSDTVAELVIGHTQKGLLKTYNLYRYESEKRAALELWGARLMQIVSSF